MHFYTYDEWVSHNYYSQDTAQLHKGYTRIFDLSDEEYSDKEFLTIRSCWRNPIFISDFTGSPIVKPKMPEIDMDIGCLYKLKGNTNSDRSKRGCLQYIGDNLGHITSSPYIGTNMWSGYYDKFTRLEKEVFTVNLNYYDEFEKILIFQSIYSGAISFQEAGSSLEFWLSDTYPGQLGYDYMRYNCKISTDIHSDDSLMVVGAMLTFDQVSSRKYVTIEAICEPVYGHVDMDNKYDWNLLWSTFKPEEGAAYLESSIMHQEKYSYT